LPAKETDDYLRVYEERRELGDWARPLIGDESVAEWPVRWYRGRIGEHFRWGYFHALWCIVLRRKAMEGLSPFPQARRNCNDLQFLIELALRYPSNLLAVPAVKKHEARRDATGSSQLTAGKSYVEFTRNYAQVIHDCFVARLPHDEEVHRIYAFRRLDAGKAALSYGMRVEALEHLSAAASWLRWPSMRFLRWIARLSPSAGATRRVMSVYSYLEYQLQKY
jgi:hypothetical protein